MKEIINTIMRIAFIITALLFNTIVYSQYKDFESTNIFKKINTSSIKNSVVIKTNLLNLLAHGPNLSVEKYFSESVSGELSFVAGQFNNFLLTDHYDYNGFLFRVKKYFNDVEYKNLNYYAGVYVGNLKRNLETVGTYTSNSLSSNSIRVGGSLGASYIFKNRVVLDAQTSLGYGKYVKLGKNDFASDASGYIDGQIWFSIGYCFNKH